MSTVNLLHADPLTLRIPSIGSRTTPSADPKQPSGDAGRSNTLQMAPWTVLCPEGMVLVPARDHRRRRLAMDDLGPGDRIGFVDNRPFSRWRLRRIVGESGLILERELIVLPTLEHPIVVVDDEASAVGYLWDAVATVPPGMARTAIPAAIALRMVRSMPWSWTGALAPGRVVVGRRP